MTHPVPTLETSRLVLQALQISDAPAIQAAFPHPDIVKYLNARIPWPYPEDGAKTFLRESALPAMATGAEWHWSIRPKSAVGEVIGVISLMDRDDDNRGFGFIVPGKGKGSRLKQHRS